MSGNTILQLSINGIWLLGLALAWRWEFMGGTMALTAFVIEVVKPLQIGLMVDQSALACRVPWGVGGGWK